MIEGLGSIKSLLYIPNQLRLFNLSKKPPARTTRLSIVMYCIFGAHLYTMNPLSAKRVFRYPLILEF